MPETKTTPKTATKQEQLLEVFNRMPWQMQAHYALILARALVIAKSIKGLTTVK